MIIARYDIELVPSLYDYAVEMAEVAVEMAEYTLMYNIEYV